MWIRYTNEEYDELVRICDVWPTNLNDIQNLAKWIKKIVDANEEQESFGKRLH